MRIAECGMNGGRRLGSGPGRHDTREARRPTQRQRPCSAESSQVRRGRRRRPCLSSFGLTEERGMRIAECGMNGSRRLGSGPRRHDTREARRPTRRQRPCSVESSQVRRGRRRRPCLSSFGLTEERGRLCKRPASRAARRLRSVPFLLHGLMVRGAAGLAGHAGGVLRLFVIPHSAFPIPHSREGRRGA